MQTRLKSIPREEDVAEQNRAQTTFFPPPESFSDYLGIPLSELNGPKKVLVSLDLLRSLIGLAAGGAAYDAGYYKEKYQDLREAQEEGHIEDLYEHFVNQGYFERRVASKQQAFPVEESWYLETYPDVASGIKSGNVDSASEHYFTTGRREGRLPSNQVPRPIQNLIAVLKMD